MNKLAQLITDAKADGWYAHIVQPDGSLHPNTERALLDGCYFDVAAAQRVMQFYVSLLRIPWDRGTPISDWERHWIDQYYPQPFDYDHWTPTKPFVILRWWYERVIAQLFGWKRSNGLRRYDKGFITTAKKSAKSSTFAGLPLYMTIAMGVEEAEAYAAAVDRDQASIIFGKTDKMVRDSPFLSDILHRVPSQKRISHDASGSFFEAISHDADSAEGKNPLLLLLDELHAWRTRKFFESLMYGDIMRAEPLLGMITTAGDDMLTVGYEEYEFACELLDPDSELYSMSHFAFIAEAGRDPVTGKVAEVPEGQRFNFQWDDPEAWQQANPSLGEGIGSIDKLKAKCEEAKASPAKKLAFIRYICNRWVDGGDNVWMNASNWRECKSEQVLVTPPGEDIWLGFDFATVEDLVALSRSWWIDHQTLGLHVQFWMPEEGIKEKSERWRVPLFDWIEAGWIRTTPGRTIDTAVLRWEISGVALDAAGNVIKQRNPDAYAQRWKMVELAFDRAHAHDLVIMQLGDTDGLPVVEHGQGFLGMSSPSKTFKKMVDDGNIVHDGDPVMDWMVGHCIVDEDPSGNVKPNKKKSRQKIDGIVSSIMSVGRAIMTAPDDTVYTRRGVLTI